MTPQQKELSKLFEDFRPKIYKKSMRHYKYFVVHAVTLEPKEFDLKPEVVDYLVSATKLSKYTISKLLTRKYKVQIGDYVIIKYYRRQQLAINNMKKKLKSGNYLQLVPAENLVQCTTKVRQFRVLKNRKTTDVTDSVTAKLSDPNKPMKFSGKEVNYSNTDHKYWKLKDLLKDYHIQILIQKYSIDKTLKDQELRKEIAKALHNEEKEKKTHTKYKFIELDDTTTLISIKDHLYKFHKTIPFAYSFDLSFGWVTEEVHTNKDGKVDDVIAHASEPILKEDNRDNRYLVDRLVKNNKDFENKVLAKLDINRIKEHWNSKSTKSQLRGIHEVMYKIYLKDFPIGKDCILLPEHISTNQQVYDGIATSNLLVNLCFWLCLSAYFREMNDKILPKHKFERDRIQKDALDLYKEFYNKEYSSSYRGIQIYELQKVEKHFNIGIIGLELESKNESKQNHKAKTIKATVWKFNEKKDNVMCLGLYLDHFYYIKKEGRQFIDVFSCDNCGKMFTKYNADKFRRHSMSCSLHSLRFFKTPTVIKPKITQFDKFVKRYLFPTEINQYLPSYDCVHFDFESKTVSQSKDNTNNLKVFGIHEPISVSVGRSWTNTSVHLNRYEFKSTQEFIDEFFKLLLKYQKEFEKRQEPLLKKILERIKKKFVVSKNITDWKILKKLDERKRQIIGKAISLVTTLKIVGFNSNKYDLPMISQYVKFIPDDNDIPKNIKDAFEQHQWINENSADCLKRNGGYVFLKFPKLQFHDIYLYSQGVGNLSKFLSTFLKTSDLSDKKFYFPYELLKGSDKEVREILKYTLKEIKYEDFGSVLSGGNTLKELSEFQKFKDTWNFYNCITLKDYLKVYNNQDISPIRKAFKNLTKLFYKEFNVDLLTDGFTLPSISSLIRRRYVWNDSKFAEFKKELEELQKSKGLWGKVSSYEINYRILQYQQQDQLKKRKTDLDVKYVRGLVDNYGRCHYCLSELSTIPSSKLYWTLDRIDSKEGHIKGNVVMCCLHCNNEKGSGAYNSFCYKKHEMYYATTYNPQAFFIRDFETYKTFKDSIRGGLSMVAHRYHKTDETSIQKCEWDYISRKWVIGKKGKLVKSIIGYDASNLYGYGQIQNMPVGEIEKIDVSLTETQKYLNDILQDKIFGSVVCDLEIPQNLYEKFKEYPPIITHRIIDGVRKLTSVMKENNYHAIMEYIKWFVQQGGIIKRIYKVFKSEKRVIAKDFIDDVSNARREGDKDLQKAMFATIFKLVSNSSYGQLIMKREEFSKQEIVMNDYEEIMKKRNSSKWKSDELMNEDSILMESYKSNQIMRNEIQEGFHVLENSKLKVLQFFYGCLKKEFGDSEFQLMQSDTDSLYCAFSESEDSVRRRLSHERYPKFIPISLDKNGKKYIGLGDKRTVGFFNVEKTGKEMVCLCPKMYRLDDKLSAKGISNNEYNESSLKMSEFRKTLFGDYTNSVKNGSMRKTKTDSGIKIITATQEKKGLSNINDKRQKLSEVITAPFIS